MTVKQSDGVLKRDYVRLVVHKVQHLTVARTDLNMALTVTDVATTQLMLTLFTVQSATNNVQASFATSTADGIQSAATTVLTTLLTPVHVAHGEGSVL